MSMFGRIKVRTPNDGIDYELRDLDNFASQFGLVTHFSNETYWEGLKECLKNVNIWVVDV